MDEKERVQEIIKILEKEVPKFKKPVVTEMSNMEETSYKILIACLLSLRTKDVVTEKAASRLFKLADTPEKMILLNVNKIEETIYPVGFYKTKAKRIKEISKTLIENYNSEVPDEIDELLKLKGVGRKTANIVVTQAFGKLGIPVDTHVNRLSNRLGIVKTRTPEQTEMELRKKLPEKFWVKYNDLLVTWGQNICVPISPKCSMCVIKPYCPRIGVIKSR